jgi:hypothetical protein
MELPDLDHDERLALVALIELVVGSDADVSDEEQAEIDRVADAFGDDAYRALATEADERFADEDELRSFLTATGRQEARELIYGTALAAALPEAVDERESALLDWLAKAWQVTVRFES